ncbi:MAG: transporter substrate-binding domain-containing protein [Gammaproteobacteria bacterium]|nr:transporter substrate-binding domain-containing protein [Gammaproteobacteria bacterium]
MITLFSLFISMNLMAAPVKTLKFAMEATYAPFEYIDESGSVSGYDVDIAKAICHELQADCVFSNQTFSGLIPSLQTGKYDALISALGITTERQKQVAFTHSYYEPSGSFVAAIVKHYTLSALLGKTIGVQIGSTYEKYLQATYGNKITIKTYASIQDAFLDLSADRINVVLADTPIVQAWLKQTENAKQYALITKPIVNPNYFGAGYGIAVRKDNIALLQDLNNALAKIKANGVYANITKKYFN